LFLAGCGAGTDGQSGLIAGLRSVPETCPYLGPGGRKGICISKIPAKTDKMLLFRWSNSKKTSWRALNILLAESYMSYRSVKETLKQTVFVIQQGKEPSSALKKEGRRSVKS